VLGDRVQVEQVVLNLIMNGIEAISASQQPTRLMRICSRRADQGYILVTVSDTGAGLDPAGSDRIFEAFYTTKAQGTGIGLSICRSIVEAHGGQLWASPNQPHGSIFSFTLKEFLVESPDIDGRDGPSTIIPTPAT
jgi:signal transduction histidine kinase